MGSVATGSGVLSISYTVEAVPNGQTPEPSTLALLTLGVAGLGFGRRKQV